MGDDALSNHDWFVSFWPDEPEVGEAAWRDHLDGRYAELREVTPVAIRRLHALLTQAEAAAELLRRDPRDPVGRGMLGEALDGSPGRVGLDALLVPAPDSSPDRSSLRETVVDALRRELLTPPDLELPLRTERLVLRPYRVGDEAAYVDAWASEEWTSLLLSGRMNPAEVGAWVRRNAERAPEEGMLRLVVEHDGEIVGDSILILQGVGLAEGEIGWTVLPQHAGRGYATEAAQAMLEVAFEHYGLRRVIANLDARNNRSAALCERLGMRREAHRIGDFWSKGQWTDSYEYALLADEWRAARG